RRPRPARWVNMERAVLVYTTYTSVVEAERAGRALVERRLCACVNILPGMISHYWWQGVVERGEEVVMIIKTRSSLAGSVSTAVKEMHSYTTPAILVLPIESVDRGYLDWLMAETVPAAKGWAALIAAGKQERVVGVRALIFPGLLWRRRAPDRFIRAAGVDQNVHRLKAPLVSRFRSSHHCAAPSVANFGIEGH